MKITIVQGAFLPVPALLGGAVEKAWYALGREFARRGHEVTHIGRRFGDLPSTEVDAGVTYRRVSGFKAPARLWLLKILDLIYSLRVLTTLPDADILVTNTFWLPLLARRPRHGRPYVHVARFPKGQLRLYPESCILQTVSAPIRTAILQEVPRAPARTRVVPYPLAPQHLSPMPASRLPVFLYAGRLHPEKGVHLLIEAFARVLPQCPGWTLRIVGPWRAEQGGAGADYREKLVAMAGDNVEFREPIFNEEKLIAEYRRASVFVYPSLAARGETFGLSVLEAMGAGAVPIVSGLPCFGDFVTSGENGLSFDHESERPAELLAAAMVSLAQDPQRLNELRRAARVTAENHNLAKVGQRFLDDFSTIITGSPRRALQPDRPLTACIITRPTE